MLTPNTAIRNRFESWGALETTLLWTKELHANEGQRHLCFHSLGVFVKEGEVSFDIDGEASRYPQGTWIFPKNGKGTFSLGEGSRVLAIRFFMKWPNGAALFPRSSNAVFQAAEAPKLEKTANALAKYIFKNQMLDLVRHSPQLNGSLKHYISLQPLFSAWISACYNTFVRHGYEPSRFMSLSSKVRDGLRYLRDRPLETPFHEKELADYMGLSLSQACKVFVQEIGTTPQSYWNSRRLKAAKLDLGDPDKSIKEIAFSLGFSSQGHFSHWFQKQKGSTPRQFRNSIKSEEEHN